MGSSATSGPRFLPEPETQEFLARALGAVTEALGAVARAPRWLGAEPPERPGDLDSLFGFVCGLQEEIGQGDLEFTLLEIEPGKPPVPPGFEPVGDPTGHLLHTFARGPELLLLVTPALFRVRTLLLGSVARELGRMGLWQRQREVEPAGVLAEVDPESAAELAGIALGMGLWLANGAYIFENSCCGGGCGIDLRGIRAGLSLPEVSFALALDARRKGLSRWTGGRGLDATQKAAFKACWGASAKAAPALAAASSGGSLRA
ncbi:MAG: hypothetical protein R3B09_27180 [Nannocystaceae bacterium]